MAKPKIGILENSKVRVISGCRVMFDARVTDMVNDTRSELNRKQTEKPLRAKKYWQRRAEMADIAVARGHA